MAQQICRDDAQNLDPAPLQKSITLLIVSDLSGAVMREAIDLDSQTDRWVVKVENVRPERVLPAKAQAGQLSFP
jgi:hypothetical protein